MNVYGKVVLPMREDICSIPINEAFGPKQGCPFCRIRDAAEERMALYITGAAMMQPDVRQETNRLGFCPRHFDQVLQKGSRLSVALILESLLAQVAEEAFPQGRGASKKAQAAAAARQETCFICENVDRGMAHSVECVVALWQREEEFRQLYASQPYICLPHYAMALKAGQKLPRREAALFQEATARLSQKALGALQEDVTHFCRMYDYRNAGEDWGTSRDAIQRAVGWLTSRKPDMSQDAGGKNR